MMNKTSGACVVSWDFSGGQDHGVLIVGQKEKGVLTVINSFADEEAYDIYKKLTTVKDKDAK